MQPRRCIWQNTSRHASRGLPANSMSRRSASLSPGLSTTMFARLARTSFQRQLGLRALPECTPAQRPARFGIAWASTGASTTGQRVVLIDKVPPGTTVEQLQAALPFSVTKLVSTSAPRVRRALSLLTVVPAADPSCFRAACDEATLAQEYALEGSPPKSFAFGREMIRLRMMSRHAPSATLYVTGLSSTATREALAKTLGVPPAAVIVGPRPGKGEAFAFVRFSSIEDAQAIVERAEETTLQIGGQKLDVEYMKRERAIEKRTKSATVRILFIVVRLVAYIWPRHAVRQHIDQGLRLLAFIVSTRRQHGARQAFYNTRSSQFISYGKEFRQAIGWCGCELILRPSNLQHVSLLLRANTVRAVEWRMRN
jgi:hypothetical protein